MSTNFWHVFCDPLNRADHYVRQSDVPKAIANFKTLTGEMPKYIMACPPSKYMDELTVTEDIELILQTGVSSWELRLAADIPRPENHATNIFREKIGETGLISIDEAGTFLKEREQVAADPPEPFGAHPTNQKPTAKIIKGKDVPLPVTKIRHVNSRKRQGVPKVENHVLGRPRKVGQLSLRTLYRRKAELKRKQQPVMI